MRSGQMKATALAVLFIVLSAFFIQIASVQAVAPTFSVLSWKNGQLNMVLEFSEPVMRAAGGPLAATDFTVSGADAITISSVTHNPGSRRVILTLTGNLNNGNSLFDIACTASAIKNNANEFCATSTVAVYGGAADTAAPTIREVNKLDSTGLIVMFTEPIKASTAIAGNFTLATSAVGDTETVTFVGAFEDVAEVRATGATIGVGTGNTITVGAGVTDAVGNAITQATVTLLPSLLISEVKTASATNTNDEFIEIYNKGNAAFSVGATGSQILYLHVWDGTTDTSLPLTIFNSSIPANGFYLIGTSSYSGIAPVDARYPTTTANMVNTNGAVYISLSATADTSVIDTVGWGTSSKKEGTALSDITAGTSIERKGRFTSTSVLMATGGADVSAGNSHDSQNNTTDFVVQATPAAQNTFSAPEFAFGTSFNSGGDTNAPTVVDSFPSGSTTMVPAYLEKIGIDFSEQMNGSTITTTNVKLTVTGQSTNLCSTVDYTPGSSMGADVTCSIPSASLPLSIVSHTLTVTTGVQDSNGNALASDYTVVFTPSSGGTFVSTAPPGVVGSFPAPGSDTFPIGAQNIDVNFAGSMDTTTLTSSNITLSNVTAGTPVTLGAITARTIAQSNDAMSIDVSGVTFIASNTYRLTIGAAVRNASNVMLGTAKTIDFTVNSTVDSTGPRVIGSVPMASATAVPVGSTTIMISTDDALDSTTVTSSTVKLYQGSNVIPVSVSYNPGAKQIILTSSSAADADTVYTVKLSAASANPAVKNVSDIALQDTDGSANNSYEFSFTTGGADSTPPELIAARATQRNLAVTFSEPVSETDAENLSKWTLQSPTGTAVTLSALSGSTATYDPVSMTVNLSGFNLTAGNTFRISASGIFDLSGNTVNTAAAAVDGTVADEATVGSSLGPNSSFSGNTFDNPTGFSSVDFGFVPQPSVFPANNMAGFTSRYSVDVPISEQVRSTANSGKIVLTFPQGFDVTNAAKDANSPANNDANGPGPGTVAVNDVSVNILARTITVDFSVATRCATANTDPCVSGEEHDFLHFDLTDIKNTTVPRGYDTSGYTVDIKTMTSTTTLESLTSMPFFINSSGSNTLTVNLTAAGAESESGNVVVTAFSPATGEMTATSAAFSGGAAAATFNNLPSGDYQVWTQPVLTIASTDDYLGVSQPQSVSVTGNTSKALVFTATSGLTSVTVNVSGSTGKDVDVFASGENGFVVKRISSTTANQGVTLKLGNGRWRIGVGPHLPDSGGGAFIMPTAPDYTVSSDVDIQVSGATVTEASGTANDGIVAFTLATAAHPVVVEVRNSAGLPIADAGVFMDSANTQFHTFGKTGSDGKATLRSNAGSFRLGAFLFGAPSSQEISVVVDSEGLVYKDGNTTAVSSIVIKIGKGANAISGKVTDGTNAVSGASVFAFCTTGCTTSPGVNSMTGSNGTYTLYLGNGTWKIGAFLPGYGELTQQTVVVNSANQENINFSPTGQTFRTIAGTVCKKAEGGANCSGGTGLANANVFAYSPSGAGGNHTSTASDGTYSLRVPSGSDYVVEGFVPSMGQLPRKTGVNVSADNATGQDIVVDNPSTVTINVKNSGGTAVTIADMFVELEETTTKMRSFAPIRSASSTSISVPAGSYRVFAHSPGSSLTSSDVQSDDGATTVTSGVLTVNGNETIKIVLPTLRTITGQLTDGSAAVANAWVEYAITSTGVRVGAQTDSDGNYSVKLSDGSYQVNAYKPGIVLAPISKVVTANSTQDLTASTTPYTIAGTVLVSGSGVPNAFVRAERQGGGSAGVQTDATGAYSLSVNAGTWTVTAIVKGYAAANLAENVTITNASVTGKNITLSTAVTLKDPTIQSITPSTGGTVRDDNVGITLSIPANALGSSSSAGTLEIEETNNVYNTATTEVVGDGFEITMTDGGGTSVSSLDTDVSITKTYTKAELATEGLDTQVETDKLSFSYLDTTGAWISESTTITYLDASGDAIANPADNLSDVTSVRLTSSMDHFTVFGATIPTDGLAPAAPTGVSASLSGSNPVITWSAVTTNADSSAITDLLGYEVYRDTSLSGSFTTQVNVTDVTGTTYTDTSASNGQTYYYKVTAADNGGTESAKSSATSGVTKPSGSSGGGGGGFVNPTSITLTSPNGGESLAGGSNMAVKWTYGGNVTFVNLDYSTDGGTTWTSIVKNQTNAGSYTWKVPSVTASDVKVRIQAMNLTIVTASDTSNAVFSIVTSGVAAEPTSTTAVPGTGTYKLVPGAPALPANVAVHDLVKLADDGNPATQYDTAVYYVGSDGKRHAFPNEKVYRSWYCGFDKVRILSSDEIAALPLGLNITYHPAERMVKFQTDNRVFVVDVGGKLRWVKTEAVAQGLYGNLWNKQIDDIPDVFFRNYRFGSDIESVSEFVRSDVRKAVSFPSDSLNITGHSATVASSEACLANW